MVLFEFRQKVAIASEKEKADRAYWQTKRDKMKEKLINTRSMRYRVLIGSPDSSVIVLRSDWPTPRSRDHPENQSASR